MSQTTGLSSRPVASQDEREVYEYRIEAYYNDRSPLPVTFYITAPNPRLAQAEFSRLYPGYYIHTINFSGRRFVVIPVEDDAQTLEPKT